MLHTAKFCIDGLTSDELYSIEKNLGITLDHIQQKIERRQGDGFRVWISYFYGYRLNFIVDFIKLLGKSEIDEQDFEPAENMIERMVMYLFRDESFIDRISLVRLDYRFDLQLTEIERGLLLYLYRKTASKYRHQKKYDQYQTTVYYNSKSVQCCCYDKEEEAMVKRGVVENYEEGVLRWEVRLMNQHLKYKKYRTGKKKYLKEYFQDNMFNQYMSEYFEAILFQGDYYTVTNAKKSINSSSLKKAEKEMLIQFICYVSNYGIDSAKKKYTKYYFRKFLNQLKLLQINPILIPKNKKEFPSFMRNPLSNFYN